MNQLEKQLKSIFESRGLKMREHSSRNILNYVNPKLPHVAAMGTSGGKTLMTAAKYELYYSLGILKKNDVTIILPSDKTILRGNFVKQFQFFFKDKPASFSWVSVSNRKELNKAVSDKINVIIVLPQLLTKTNIEVLKGCKVKWLVLDEAHKWYFAPTIKRIIKTLNPKHQLLLTGTPFKFNLRAKDFIIDYTSVKSMYDKGYLSDVNMQVLHSSVPLTKIDYQSLLGSLKETKRINSEKYKELFIEVLKQLVKKLKLPNKGMTTFNNISKNVISTFGKLEKTIIFCHGIPEAKCLDKYLNELGIGVLSSHSKNTEEIAEETFIEFETNPNIKVLVVVNRGKEGFDFPDLHNVIDMTFTQNFEVVMQIVGRLMRKSEKGHDKFFFKVAPKNTAGYFVDWMDTLFMLFDDYWYQNYNGKNAYDIRIPNALLARNNSNTNKGKSSTKKGDFKPKDLEKLLPNSLEFMKANAWFKLDDTLSTVATTSLQDVCNKHGMFENVKWSLEYTKNELKKYNTRQEVREAGGSLYNYACSYKLLDEMFGRAATGIYSTLTKEQTINELKKYKTRKELIANSSLVYKMGHKYKLLDEVFGKPETGVKKWTVELVQKEADKYKYKVDFKNANRGAYKWAYQRGLLDNMCKHMKPARGMASMKKLIQKTENGKIVKIWNSKKEAELIYGGGIGKTIYRNKIPKYAGFIWEYEK